MRKVADEEPQEKVRRTKDGEEIIEIDGEDFVIRTRTKDEEMLPIIRAGWWCLIAVDSRRAPRWARGRIAKITRAYSETRPGGDKHSPTPYEYQPADATFQVQVVGERSDFIDDLKRSDLEKWGQFQSDVAPGRR